MRSTYQKMAGKFASWFGPSGFWVGENHFLYTQGFIIEDYRRFYFEDIEAIVIQPSIARNVQTFVYALFAGVSLFPLYYFDGAVRGLGMLPACFFLILFAANYRKGPTCTFRIITSVSDCRIRTFNRLSAAYRYRDELVAWIEAAQGPQSGVVVIDEPVPPEPARPVRREDGVFHVLSLVCMLGMAVLSLMLMIDPSVLFASLGGLVILVTLVASVGALVRQRSSDMPPGLRAWTWGVFGNFFIDLTLAYMGFVFASAIFSETGGFSMAGEWFENIHIHAVSGAILDHLYFFFFLCSGLLAATGAVLLVRYNAGKRPDAAPASAPPPGPGVGA